MSVPSCVPEDMGAKVNWLLTSQYASGAWAHDAPTAQETAFILLGLLRGPHSSHEPLHRAARYVIVDQAPYQEHFPELWFSKALYAPTIVVRSTILSALGLYCDFCDVSGSVWR